MSVVFASASSLFKTSTGTAVGMSIENGSPVNVVSVTAKKSGSNASATLSAWAQGLGGTAQGSPGSLSQYLDGLGIIVGMSGHYEDSIATLDGSAVFASVNGVLNKIVINGIAFHRVEEATSSGSSCSARSGHGIEAVLAYFQDNRLANPANAGRYTTVRIGSTKLDCSVVGVDFRMADIRYNLWQWDLHLLASATIEAGSSTTSIGE